MFIAYLRKGQRSTVWNPLSATRTSLSCHRRNAATCHSRGGGAKNKCDTWITWVLAIHFLSIPNLDFWPDPSISQFDRYLQQTWFRRWSRIYNFYILLPWFGTFRRALPIHPFFFRPLNAPRQDHLLCLRPTKTSVGSRSTKPIWKTTTLIGKSTKWVNFEWLCLLNYRGCYFSLTFIISRYE